MRSIIVGIIVIGAELVSLIGLYFILGFQTQHRRIEIAHAQKQVTESGSIGAQTRWLNAAQQEVIHRAEFVRTVTADRHAPERLLNAVAAATPTGVWLSQFDDVHSVLSLEGFGLTNLQVSQFIGNLVALKTFFSVDLKYSKIDKINGINMYKFNIVCQKKTAG